MTARTRDAVAVVVAVIAFGLGAYAFAYGSADMGVEFGYATDDTGSTYIVVSDVAPWSPLAGEVEIGAAVVSVDEASLVPPFQFDVKPPVQAEPPSLPTEPLYSFTTVPRSELELWLATGVVPVHGQQYTANEWLLDESGSAPVLGLVILGLGGWWLRSGRAGEALRRLAIPAVVAIATPLLLVPVAFTTTAGGFVALAFLLPLAQLPFGDGLAAEIDDDERRGRARLWLLAAFSAAVVAGLLVLTGGLQSVQALAQWLMVGAIAVIPAVTATQGGGRVADATVGGSPTGRLTQSLELAAAGATPFVAMTALVAPNAPPLTLPLLLWILALVAAQRYTVRPFARMATRATLQRDLVVAATEAERARIAADLHDVAIQELTLLARRLDVRGDVEDAASARRVVEQLRTITGELRLPILDDLGVGPALEWLVSRMERLAGGDVRLERDDGSRLPPDVELAFFRVAQEALANAVKHGRPPIVVRYRVSPSGATLTVDDAGPGIEPEAAEAAPAAGHFGLLGMQQRAEQIGAILDVRRWPSGGTHVALDWRAR